MPEKFTWIFIETQYLMWRPGIMRSAWGFRCGRCQGPHLFVIPMGMN